MTLRIVHEPPPNYAQVIAVFPYAKGVGTFFTYGRCVFIPNPNWRHGGLTLSEALMAHETVHADRQSNNAAGWWRRYLDDPEFRLAEELPAHKAEFATFATDNRARRRAELRHIAHRLSGPLYGRLLTVHKAKQLITGLSNPDNL